jgi:DNA polymerase III alpha subunit
MIKRNSIGSIPAEVQRCTTAPAYDVKLDRKPHRELKSYSLKTVQSLAKSKTKKQNQLSITESSLVRIKEKSNTNSLGTLDIPEEIDTIKVSKFSREYNQSRSVIHGTDPLEVSGGSSILRDDEDHPSQLEILDKIEEIAKKKAPSDYKLATRTNVLKKPALLQSN